MTIGVRNVTKSGGLWATLRHVSPAVAVVKLDRSDLERRSLQAEVTRDQHEALQARVGESLYVKPRKLRIFVEQEEGASNPPDTPRASQV